VCDRVEDLICCFVSDEGLWIAVVISDEGSDGLFQLFGGAVNASPELFFR
jgi:hypothetical protein